MIQNEEDISGLKGKVDLINHVHISEPGLKPVQRRKLHEEWQDILRLEEYTGFVSTEVTKVDYLQDIEKVMEYVREKFD